MFTTQSKDRDFTALPFSSVIQVCGVADYLVPETWLTKKVGIKKGILLTHWRRVRHICVSNLTINGSDNGLSPDRRQAITWTNVGILLIGPLGTNFSEMLIEIHTFSFKKIHFKMSSGKWRPFCLGLNVLRIHSANTVHYHYNAVNFPNNLHNITP